MTNDQLKKLETLHIEAEQTAAEFQAIAVRAEAGSETAKQFKKLADSAFDQANSYYQVSLDASGASLNNSQHSSQPNSNTVF